MLYIEFAISSGKLQFNNPKHEIPVILPKYVK